jgi:hypothetical protein
MLRRPPNRVNSKVLSRQPLRQNLISFCSKFAANFGLAGSRQRATAHLAAYEVPRAVQFVVDLQ